MAVCLLVACGDDNRADSSVGSATVTMTATITVGPITATGSTLTEGATQGTGPTEGTASGGDTDGTSESPPTTSNGSMTSVTTQGGPKFDLGVTPDGGTSCAGNMDIDESFIWIPATSHGHVSKINTRTLVEEGRYLTGPSGGTEDVSRTAVSGDGRFVVVNARGTGRSTAVAANIADCIDANGDGQITTSTGPADVKPWGTDECVVWTILHANWSGGQTHGPRGITWTIGDYDKATCTYKNQKVWLGFGAMQAGAANFVRLDGATGLLEQSIEAAGWNGSGYAPYGGALDPQDNAWFTGLRGELARVNTSENPITITRIPQPGNIQSYGMTVDRNGNPWMAGCSGPVSTYDVNSGQWISVAGANACHRGMAIDHNDHAWVASNGPCGLVEIDVTTRTLVAFHNLAQCSTPIGVSVDVDGFVWLVDQAGWAWKIDPMNVGAMQNIPVEGNHYVYSDMTGGQLKSVTPPPG
ncbi:lyase [Nannocystis pusilla]|uniref:Lyase n=1 Tax=Nannocystis pusilla TaxID=889268 RepID=A0ABS7U139_9BACT|nr:lyase [Nannocystis pusilla]MBZ5714146.1 lyase [Nannocystis pusilla]